MDNETFKKAKDKIKNTLDAKSKNLRINNIAPTKTGGVLINCSTEEDLNQAKTILDNNAAELKLKPKYPSKKLPKINVKAPNWDRGALKSIHRARGNAKVR